MDTETPHHARIGPLLVAAGGLVGLVIGVLAASGSWRAACVTAIAAPVERTGGMVLVMHDVEGLTHDEIADRMGIAVGTSKSQLHKARARMRDMLAPARERNEAGNHA